MLFWIISNLQQHYSVFRLFQYLTFRSILAILTALVISFLVWPWMLKLLTRLGLGQAIREEGPKSHYDKAGTPTMGGGLLIIAVCFSTLLWADLSNAMVWLVMLVTLAFACLGFVDDYLKIKHQHSDGITPIAKLTCQLLISTLAVVYIYQLEQYSTGFSLLIPYTKELAIPLGIVFVPFAVFVIAAFSNAVNLTDGLDGLAIMPSVLVIGALGIFAYLSGNKFFASYLSLPYIQGSGELIIFCAAFVGAGLGFLWFNSYPAQVFMGDVGALSIGAAMATIAILVRQELVLVIMGGLFVLETFSVVIQVVSYKLWGRRIFKMAPLHHHFELKGWPEPKIIVRFWIIALVLVLVGLAAIKVR